MIRNQTYVLRRTARLRREEAQRANLSERQRFMNEVRRAQIEGVAQAIANAVVHMPSAPADAGAGSTTH